MLQYMVSFMNTDIIIICCRAHNDNYQHTKGRYRINDEFDDIIKCIE